MNLVFVAIFVLQTYPLGDALHHVLWRLDVGIALLFLGEYLLRLYSAEYRFTETFTRSR